MLQERVLANDIQLPIQSAQLPNCFKLSAINGFFAVYLFFKKDKLVSTCRTPHSASQSHQAQSILTLRV